MAATAQHVCMPPTPHAYLNDSHVPEGCYADEGAIDPRIRRRALELLRERSPSFVINIVDEELLNSDPGVGLQDRWLLTVTIQYTEPPSDPMITEPPTEHMITDAIVLRVPNASVGCPAARLRNNIVSTVVASELLRIPELPLLELPRTHAFECDGISHNGLIFSIETDIPGGEPLDEWWEGADAAAKATATKQLAAVYAALATCRAPVIGALGYGPDMMSIGPPLERANLFEHGDITERGGYPLGPYRHIRDYILAYCAKQGTRGGKALRRFKAAAELDVIPDEPFAFSLPDLRGYDVTVDADGNILTIQNWDLAGHFPLSDVVPRNITETMRCRRSQVSNTDEEAELDELFKTTVIETAEKMGMDREEAEMMMGPLNERVHYIRSEQWWQ